MTCFAAEDSTQKVIFGSGLTASGAKTQAGYALVGHHKK